MRVEEYSRDAPEESSLLLCFTTAVLFWFCCIIRIRFCYTACLLNHSLVRLEIIFWLLKRVMNLYRPDRQYDWNWGKASQGRNRCLLLIDAFILCCLCELLQPPFWHALHIVWHWLFLAIVRESVQDLANPRQRVVDLHGRRVFYFRPQIRFPLACKSYVLLTCELPALTFTFDHSVCKAVDHELLRQGL